MYLIMKTDFTIGILKGLGYYTIALGAYYITYAIFGWEYMHGPGFHHLIAFIFLICAFAWTVHKFILILLGKTQHINYGLFTVHVILLSSIILFLAIDSN